MLEDDSKTKSPEARGVNRPASKVDALITDAHPERLRRSERAFLRIPIQVQGKNEAGAAFSEQTSTLVINRNGARISLKARVRLQDPITVTNLQNSMTCPFRVVERVTKPIGPETEWGVECLRPETSFWGISFPERAIDRSPKPAVEDSVDALLECSVCGAREFAHLTLGNYRELGSKMQLERSCPQCGRPTAWRFGFVEEEGEEWSPAPPAEGKSGAERRLAKRLAIKLPVKIRLPDGRQEVARTEDLSKTGACFTSTLDLRVGERVHLVVGYSEGSTAPEVAARVLRRREFEAGKTALYGVILEELTEAS
jgi:PilZ domain-containing protein